MKEEKVTAKCQHIDYKKWGDSALHPRKDEWTNDIILRLSIHQTDGVIANSMSNDSLLNPLNQLSIIWPDLLTMLIHVGSVHYNWLEKQLTETASPVLNVLTWVQKTKISNDLLPTKALRQKHKTKKLYRRKSKNTHKADNRISKNY